MRHNFAPTALALAIVATFSCQSFAQVNDLTSTGTFTGREHWVVNSQFNGNGESLNFSEEKPADWSLADRLTVNAGASISNVDILHVGGDRFTNNGTVSVNNLTFGPNAAFVNSGTVETTSFTTTGVTSIANNETAILKVKDGKFTIAGMTNNGTLATDSDEIIINASHSVTFGKDATVTGKDGQLVSLTVDISGDPNLQFTNNSTVLEVQDLTTDNFTNNGVLHAHGNFTAVSNFNSGTNSVLDVDNNATFKANVGGSGSIDVAGTLSFEDNVYATFKSVKANNLLTSQAKGFWIENLKELQVKNLSVGNYAAVKFDESVDAENKIVNVENLSFAKKGANIQLFSDLVVSNTVSAEFGGGIRFNEENYKASLNEVKVGEGSDFFLRSDEGNNQIKISTAIFGDNAKLTGIVNKETGEVEGTEIAISITDLTAEGNFTIDDTLLTSDGQIEIQNLHANGGEVKIDHELSGTSSVLSVNKGARVALGGVNTDTFNIELKTLEKGAVSVASVSDTTKTHVDVDGSLNNKEASEVIAAMNGAVQLGEKEQDFAFKIGEGDVMGPINGKGDNYTQGDNTKLAAFGSVTALSALTLRHEMNSLSKRMGELRDAPAGVGAWVRGYGSEMEYGAQNVTAKNNSIQMGSDYTVGDWKVGAAFTYTDGESSYDNGSADNKGYGVAVYGTWFVPCGAYVDLMAKYNRLDNDFALNGMDGSYDANAYGLSAETGYRFNFMDGGVYVEPQVGIAYSRMTGETFTASNGVTIEQDDYDSLIGRVGVRTGFKFPKDKGTIYARVSGVYDFQGEVNGTATKGQAFNTIEEDLGGAWLEVGVGANFNWTKDTYTYIDFERTNGGEVKENYRWNIGVRHNF